MEEPIDKRCFAFFDGQNLYHSTRKVFGYSWPNYDPILLVNSICLMKGWQSGDIFFYTGIPSQHEDPRWNHFWVRKLQALGARGVHTYSRTVKNNKEKGIDLRLGLDLVSRARKREYDVALIFSQDQDFTEAVREIREITVEQDRWIKVASAFPFDLKFGKTTGIAGTEMIRISKAMYDACIDLTDYRIKKKRTKK